MTEDAGRDLSAVVAFYDGLANDYHLVYGERWDEAVSRKGAVLDGLIRAHSRSAVDVLDCACGIGTQAIGLARRGYRVVGSDVSELALERAEVEAACHGVKLELVHADFRDLSSVEQRFGVVLCCDNALPHLLDDDQIERAFAAMHAKLREGGLVIASVRDYDRALAERPPTTMPVLIPGPPRRIVVRVHDWDMPDSPLYTVRFLILTETAGQWSVAHQARYRAIGSAALTGCAERGGLRQVRWHAAAGLGFHQSVMTAVRARD
jgi:SAM-dependent methyltransferase